MAFLVSVALFAYFWLIGFALLGVLGRQNDLVRNVLIAPAAGIVLQLYLLYVPSRAGLAIGTVALPETLVLLTLAAAALVWRRPRLPGRRGLPYLALMPLAFLASGWPLLQDGFAWFSHFNPDAANYMLDAERLRRYSYLEVTDAAQWRDLSDWASYYVILPLVKERTSAELIFAWAVTLSGLDEPAIYMPLILSWHVAALAGGAALIGTAGRFARLLGAALLVTAALSSVGVTSQLLGQELGLTILALGAVLLLTPFYRLAWPALLRHSALTALVLAGLLLGYPELLPFLGLGFIVYHGCGPRDVLDHWRKAVPAAAVIGFAALLSISPDAFDMIQFLLRQATSAAGKKRQFTSLFPYFLVPSGAAALWGFVVYSSGASTLLTPASAILSGLALSGAAVLSALWLAWWREAVAAIVVIMAALAAALISGNVGFGSFKLAMFMQPFLLPMTVLAVCRLLRVAR